MIEKMHIIFKSFLKSFFGTRDKNTKTTIEIIKKIKCFIINNIGYSVPIKD